MWEYYTYERAFFVCREDKVLRDDLVNDDIGSTRFGDIGGQLRKQLLQVCRIGCDGYMGSTGVCRPVIQSGHIHAVCPHKANAINNDAFGPGCGGNRSRRRPGCGLAVCKEDDDLVLYGGAVQKLGGLRKSISMIGGSPCCQRVHRIFEGIHRCDQLRIGHGSVREADNGDMAAGTNDIILGTAGSFRDNVNKGFGAVLHIG